MLQKKNNEALCPNTLQFLTTYLNKFTHKHVKQKNTKCTYQLLEERVENIRYQRETRNMPLTNLKKL